jgi:Tfp pilus assembly protein PilF
MSLINEALKTAQKQRTARLESPGANPFFDGLFPVSPRTSQRQMSRAFLMGIIGAGIIGLAFAGIVVLRLKRNAAPSMRGGGQGRLVANSQRAAAKPISHLISDTAAQRLVAVQQAVPASAARTAAVALTDVVKRGNTAAPVSIPAQSPPQSQAQSPPQSPPQSPVVVQRTAIADSAKTPAATSQVPAATALPRSVVQITVDAKSLKPVDALMAQAVAAQRHGDRERAKQLYDQAIAVGPPTAALYNNYGALLKDMGDPQSATAILRLAISLDGAMANAWVNLGAAQDELGDHANATGSYSRALQLDPGNEATKVNLAAQYVELGSFSDARRMLEDVIRANPNNADAHYSLGRSLEAQKDYTGAIREFSRFLELGGGSSRPGLENQVRAHLNALRLNR